MSELISVFKTPPDMLSEKSEGQQNVVTSSVFEHTTLGKIQTFFREKGYD